MGSQSCEQCAGSNPGEPRTCQRCCRQERGEAEASEQKRMLRKVLNWSKKFGRKVREMVDERLKQRAVLGAVGGFEVCYSVLDRTFEQDGGAIIEWMSAGSGRLDPWYVDGQRLKERARDTQGIDRGAKIMPIARQRSLRSRAGATNLRVAFDDRSRNPCGGKHNRRRKAIGTGADNGCRCHRNARKTRGIRGSKAPTLSDAEMSTLNRNVVA